MAAKKKNRRLLTDRFLRSLPPARRGHRGEVFDARLPGFGIRISDTVDADPTRRGKAGRISFILYGRFAPGAAPARRTIGVYGEDAMRLEDARRIAGEWRSQIARGIDPAVIEVERRAAEARERALRVKHSFTIAAEAFIAAKLEKERSGKVAERDLRSVFIAAWGERPVSEITKTDVLEIIITKRNTAPQMARALLVLIKRFFGWVVDQEIYGLSTSPCEGLSGKKLIGELQSRDRRLSDAEIFAFWRATGRIGYPAGAVYRMLLLTGLRLNEAAQISWPEVQGNTIVIPASRMKGREGKAREHLVPLSSAAREVIASLPRIKNGPFLFSLKAGKTPMSVTGPIKADLDRRMLRTLKALARRRGEDHQAVDLPGWVNHDLRRVVRSGLSALRVPHNVAEAVLAHRPPGIVGTYNLHEYEDEKAEALEAWAQRLATIVNPSAKVPDKKIVPLRKRRR
ncbi:integrase [Bradyrhizobium sp. F1.13.1]